MPNSWGLRVGRWLCSSIATLFLPGVRCLPLSFSSAWPSDALSSSSLRPEVSAVLLSHLAFLSDSAQEVAKGNFDASLPTFKHNDEVAQLRDSFGIMQQSLKQYMEDLKESTTAKASIERELDIAHNIQMSMLPKTFPASPIAKTLISMLRWCQPRLWAVTSTTSSYATRSSSSASATCRARACLPHWSWPSAVHSSAMSLPTLQSQTILWKR